MIKIFCLNNNNFFYKIFKSGKSAGLFLTVLCFIISCSQGKKNDGVLYKVNVKGIAEIIRDSKTIPLKTGDSVMEKDIVKSPANAEVDIIIGKDDNLRLKPNTSVTLDTFGSSKQNFSIKLNAGKVIAKLDAFKENKSEFKIQTQTSVCGVRGTQFSIESKIDEDELNVLKGEVKVTSIGVADEISVSENQSTVIRPGRPPMQPGQILEALNPLLSLEVATMRPDLTIDAVKTTMEVFDLKTYQRSIEYFQANNNRLPATLKEIQMSEIDQWGIPLIYYLKGNGYVLFSAGQDKIIGTFDDIQLEQ